MRIAVVAPSTPIAETTAAQVEAFAADAFPGVEIVFHPQCFARHNHFAGPDAVRAEAFVATANDPAFDAIWFARGGYGSCRVAEPVLERLGPTARQKAYLGYSDAGFLLAGLHKRAIGTVAHGPMPNDILRIDGEAAVRRALAWLTTRDPLTLEGSLGEARAAAFNLTVFGHLLGTPLEPELDGYELLLEDVAEHMYRTDRAMFHVTSSPAVRRAAGIRLGRCSEVPVNDPDFGESEQEVFRYWCARAGIPYLGRADIGHDADNKVVPFGRR